MVNINSIYQYGDQTRLNARLNFNKSSIDKLHNHPDWSRYNPRKNINREGLCIFNESGITGPGPALDSLYEYNRENNTTFTEIDFNKPTQLFKDLTKDGILNQALPPDNIVRSHFLRLNPGGYFPAHRDHIGTLDDQDTFRIIYPIENCNPPECWFMLEDRSLKWDESYAYIINTTKAHTLFNASTIPSLWLVLNVMINQSVFDWVNKNLSVR